VQDDPSEQQHDFYASAVNNLSVLDAHAACMQDGPLPPCSLPSAPMTTAAASSAISGKVLQTDGKQLAQLLLRLSELQVRGQLADWLAGWLAVNCFCSAN
jgi:hypothetical protein